MNFKLCVAVLLITIMAHISGMNTNKAIDLSGINYAVELQDYRYEICLKKGDKNIGKAVFLLSKGKKTATLWYLEINSELRNKGLGSHLFKAATNLLHCMEIQKVHVMVMPLDLDGMDDADIEKNNKALQKFYEKLG